MQHVSASVLPTPPCPFTSLLALMNAVKASGHLPLLPKHHCFVQGLNLFFIYFPCVQIISCVLSQDAHEFLCQCLDQLKEEVAKVNKSLTNDAMASSPVLEGTRSGQDTVSSTARSGGLKEVGTAHIYTCPVVNNMEFEVQHTITCKRWGQLLFKGHFSVLNVRYWYQKQWTVIFEDRYLYSVSHMYTESILLVNTVQVTSNATKRKKKR